MKISILKCVDRKLLFAKKYDEHIFSLFIASSCELGLNCVWVVFFYCRATFVGCLTFILLLWMSSSFEAIFFYRLLSFHIILHGCHQSFIIASRIRIKRTDRLSSKSEWNEVSRWLNQKFCIRNLCQIISELQANFSYLKPPGRMSHAIFTM